MSRKDSLFQDFGNKVDKEYRWDDTSANSIFHFTAKYCSESELPSRSTPTAVEPRALTGEIIEVRWKDNEATARKKQQCYRWLSAKVLKYDENHMTKSKPAQFKVKYEDDDDIVWHNLDKKIWRLRAPYEEVVKQIVAFYKEHHPTKKRADVEKMLEDPRWINDLILLKESLKKRYKFEPDFSAKVLDKYSRDPAALTKKKKAITDKEEEEEAKALKLKEEAEADALRLEKEKEAKDQEEKDEEEKESLSQRLQKDGFLHFSTARTMQKALWKMRFVKLTMHSMEVWKSDKDHQKFEILMKSIKEVQDNPAGRGKGNKEFWVIYQNSGEKASQTHKVKAGTEEEKMEWVNAINAVKEGRELVKEGGGGAPVAATQKAEEPKAAAEPPKAPEVQEDTKMHIEKAAEVVRKVKSVLRVLLHTDFDPNAPDLSEEHMREAFDLIDKDSSGTVNPKQFSECLETLEFDSSREAVYTIFATVRCVANHVDTHVVKQSRHTHPFSFYPPPPPPPPPPSLSCPLHPVLAPPALLLTRPFHFSSARLRTTKMAMVK
jgi:hypothetical protein